MRLVENVSSGRGRNADVYLLNGVVVSWDAHSQTIWTEGPRRRAERVEKYLRTRYESRGLRRWSLTGWYMATAFLRAPLARLSDQLRSSPPEGASRAPFGSEFQPAPRK